ncbi:MAG: alkyl hydroperoxide reductase, partial [Rhodomicrobium sp.]|nr:alkyl hydroperoxide reductase [Rhodomicrobium sp.]
MPLEAIKDRIGSFAKDVKLNLSSMLSDETMQPQTKYGLFLALALAVKHNDLIKAFEAEASRRLSPQAFDAARAAASSMA